MASQLRSFETELTTGAWKIIQEEGKFGFNPDGDPARRVDVVLSDWNVEVVAPEDRTWENDNERHMKANTTVLLRFKKKAGA
jgi:hypothetical protein